MGGSPVGWLINCSDPGCGKRIWADNIVDLITTHIDSDGWLLCSCGKAGSIQKSFELQEPGETWEPFLRGVIPLGDPSATYQPFVFLCSYEPTGPVTGIWFSYYKDLRSSGGRLKLGYGPGGPPVLSSQDFLSLVKRLVEIGCISRSDLTSVLET